MFSVDAEGFKNDLHLTKIRKVLIRIIESEESAAVDLRTLCVKLMYWMGFNRASAEDLLRAAAYQAKYKIDLTDDAIQFFCKQQENYVPPLAEELTEEERYLDIRRHSTVQSEITFERGIKHG